MSDLEDLKQQLYAKIQARQKPEQAPSELELLKYSQLPAYEANQRLRSLLQGGDGRQGRTAEGIAWMMVPMKFTM